MPRIRPRSEQRQRASAHVCTGLPVVCTLHTAHCTRRVLRATRYSSGLRVAALRSLFANGDPESVSISPRFLPAISSRVFSHLFRFHQIRTSIEHVFVFWYNFFGRSAICSDDITVGSVNVLCRAGYLPGVTGRRRAPITLSCSRISGVGS